MLRASLTALLTAAAVVLAAGSAAHARSIVIATGTGELALTDVPADKVVARLALGSPTRAVVAAPDGARAFVASGRQITVVDLASRATASAPPLAGAIISLAISQDGARLLAARRGAIDVFDTATMTPAGSINLKGARPGAVAISADGLKAAVVLGRRLGLVDMTTARLMRRTGPTALGRRGAPLPGGVAFPQAGSLVWVSTTDGVLSGLDRVSGRPRARINLKPGVGAGLAISPDGSRAAVGANRGSRAAAIVNLNSKRLLTRVRTGRGPGAPAYATEDSRLYIGDGGAHTVSVFSTISYKRLGVQRLGARTTPRGLAVQPGLAVKIGSEGPDNITGTRGRDRIDGRGGDDALRGGRANDSLLGGLGNDVLGGGASNDVLDGGDGNDYLTGQAGNDSLFGATGNDQLFGGTGNDNLDGGSENDFLEPGDGDDIARGGPGNDKIVEADLGNDFLLDGGDGDDFVDGARGTDNIVGGAGDDTLRGGPGAEKIDGGIGDDNVDGGTGGDQIFTREGNDAVRGDAGRDRISTSAGDDNIDGGSGDDTISSFSGNDEIVGGPGADTITAGSGDDVIRVADEDADVVDCSTGRDTVYVESTAPSRDRLTRCETVIQVAPEPSTDAPPTARTVPGTPGNDRLLGSDEKDSVFGADGDDELFGNGGDDYVDGENGNDVLHGGLGNDQMYGRRDNDVVLGNEGDDFLNGDRGLDTINGGPGNDRIFGGLDSDNITGDEGDDRINVVDGSIDRVDCGDGNDTVLVDVVDVVTPNCESVRR